MFFRNRGVPTENYPLHNISPNLLPELTNGLLHHFIPLSKAGHVILYRELELMLIALRFHKTWQVVVKSGMKTF
jgi:hypothetical protein